MTIGIALWLGILLGLLIADLLALTYLCNIPAERKKRARRKNAELKQKIALENSLVALNKEKHGLLEELNLVKHERIQLDIEIAKLNKKLEG